MTFQPARAVPLTLLLLAYGYYVLQNATLLHEQLPSEAKHFIIIAVAAVAMATRPKQAILAALLACPIAAIYFMGGLPLYGVMVVVFGLSLPVFSSALSDLLRSRRHAVIVVMLMISFVPALLSFDNLLSAGIIDTTYGRGRALLGYFHPKEAGVCFGIPLLLALMMMRRGWMIATLLATAFVYLVGSRNVAMLLLLSAALRQFPRLTLWALVGALLAVVMVVTIDPGMRELLDTVISLRLSVWRDALAAGPAASGLDVLDGDRLAIDSFFVEAFVAAGWASLPLIAIWLFGMVAIAQRGNSLRPFPTMAVWLLVFFISFDSGVASTGNMMHVVLWALALHPLFARTRRSERTEMSPGAADGMPSHGVAARLSV